MAKGDKVTIWYSVGSEAKSIEVTANQNGRKLEVNRTKNDLEIAEKTRGGTIVRNVWFPLTAVLSIDDQRTESD